MIRDLKNIEFMYLVEYEAMHASCATRTWLAYWEWNYGSIITRQICLWQFTSSVADVHNAISWDDKAQSPTSYLLNREKVECLLGESLAATILFYLFLVQKEPMMIHRVGRVRERIKYQSWTYIPPPLVSSVYNHSSSI